MMHGRNCADCGKEFDGPGGKCSECLHKTIGGHGRDHLTGEIRK